MQGSMLVQVPSINLKAEPRTQQAHEFAHTASTSCAVQGKMAARLLIPCVTSHKGSSSRSERYHLLPLTASQYTSTTKPYHQHHADYEFSLPA
jgi:hypothetical protein